ncbi:MAG: hypothetical protein ACI82Q_002222, partial [Nonlabens sp.]
LSISLIASPNGSGWLFLLLCEYLFFIVFRLGHLKYQFDGKRLVLE